MLSGQEEQAFAQIAEQIAADDPGFAASMGRLESRRAGRGHYIVTVAAAATAVLCLLLSLVLPGFVAAALAFAAYHFRPSRPSRPSRRPVHRRRRRPR
jgi:Protein of unknown function (DUF3040)